MSIIEALRRKDREAWESVYRECADAVYRHALYRAGGRREAAEDVTQEVFIRALEQIGSFRGTESSLTAWLRGIGRRVLARRAREKPLLRLGPGPPGEDELPGGRGGLGEPVDPRPLPSEHAASREQQLLVGAALTALPPHWEAVLRWKYVDDLRVDDIARRLDVSPKAAESLLSRARTAFRVLYIRFLASGNGRIHEVEDWSDVE